MQSTVQRRPTSADANTTINRTAGQQLPIADLVGIAGLSAVIAIHTSELSGKVDETAYLGFGYVLLIAASIVSIVLLSQRDIRGWYLGGFAALATIVGFVLTRTTGLPAAKGDIGNWGETIAIWSLVAEGLVVLLTAYVLITNRRGTAPHTAS